MSHDRTYHPIPHVPAPRLRDADGSMRQAPRRSAGYAATHPVQPLKGPHETRATDVSYRALAPGGAGFCYRICAGTSESRLTANYSLLTANSYYTFSAKEKDSETGLSYFGSRYYSSDLSIWLSVDPMAAEYPSLSPYVYCADNPVRLVDPDGEHFEVVVEENTITIKATYYAADDDKALLQQGINFWKQQSGKYSYVTENGESYTINFDLSIAEGPYSNSFEAKSAVKTQTSMNYFEILQNVLDKDENPIRGKCNAGFGIEVSSDYTLAGYNPTRTAAHEIGHTLGCADTFLQDDLMESGGVGSTIGIHNIRAIMLEAEFVIFGYANIGNDVGKCVKRNVEGKYFGKVIENQ